MRHSYTLEQLADFFISQDIATLSSENAAITLDDKHDVSLIQFLTHNDSLYFSLSNNATNLNESYWLTDNHTVMIEFATEEETATEDATTEDSTIAINPDHENLVSKLENLDIDEIADLCTDLSSIQIMELIGKLSKIAVKNSNSENKKITKKDKPEKTQVFITKKVSAKNFNYYDLLKSWHGIQTDKIIADGLNDGYSSSVINEDKRVINVLMGTDKDIVIGQDWIDYIVNFWSQNPDTTWVRLHYAFSKGGRKCSDRGLLCNYIIDNGVSKEDIEAAIASQN